jgi:C4-dicarboxylate transporter, DctM subunit
MDPTLIIILAVVVLLLLLVLETPVAFALALSGSLGLILLHDTQYMGSVLASVPFQSTSRFAFTIVPMFILMGIFAVHGRIAEQVYRVSNYVFQKVPGGLGCATVMACAGFAAVTGSSVATAATMARLSIDQMLRYGYPARFASGLVAASGTLGVMIPPSIILILYAILTGESTGALLAAGIVPGLLSAAGYLVYILVRGRKLIGVPEVAGGSTDEDSALSHELDELAARARETSVDYGRFRDLPWRGVVRVAILAGIVLGGIYSGVFTATESGALGALAAMIIMFVELRREGARTIWSRVVDALRETAQTTSMVFTIVVGSIIFSRFLSSSRIPQMLTAWITDLPVEPWMIVVILLLAMIPLGMALESLSILVITMPLIYPAVTALGFDGIWFGILVVKMIEVGLITPPVGIAVYVVAGATDKVRVETVFRGVMPFLAMDAVVIAILFAFPDLVLWLPRLAAPG